MSERMIERDESGREIVYMSGKDLPSKFEWSKHINNCVLPWRPKVASGANVFLVVHDA